MKIRIFYTSNNIDEVLDKKFFEFLKDFEFIGSGYDFMNRERDLEFESRKSDKTK